MFLPPCTVGGGSFGGAGGALIGHSGTDPPVSTPCLVSAVTWDEVCCILSGKNGHFHSKRWYVRAGFASPAMQSSCGFSPCEVQVCQRSTPRVLLFISSSPTFPPLCDSVLLRPGLSFSSPPFPILPPLLALFFSLPSPASSRVFNTSPSHLSSPSNPLHSKQWPQSFPSILCHGSITNTSSRDERSKRIRFLQVCSRLNFGLDM